MAIFTEFANYLKCRSYFEDTLGFHSLKVYDSVHSPDPSDVNPDNTSKSNPNEEYVLDTDYAKYGIFASMHNFKIAQNIWFLYGKSLPWPDDDNPAPETEVGLELTTAYPHSDSSDLSCGFLLDPKTVENQEQGAMLEFIGMKRVIPIPLREDGDPIPAEDPSSDDEKIINDIREKNKDVIQFLKHKVNNKSYSSISDYDKLGVSVKELNEKKPNSLKITTSYDYDDFGKRNNKEYNVRQLGMLNLLHAPQTSLDLIKNNTCLFNGIKSNPESTKFYNLCELLNITADSIVLSSDEAETFNVHPTVNPNNWDNTDTSNNRNFLGVLHFYMNSIPNNRITYQTDYYNFVLTFENRKPCVCTCENCLNNDNN